MFYIYFCICKQISEIVLSLPVGALEYFQVKINSKMAAYLIYVVGQCMVLNLDDYCKRIRM